MVRVFANGPGDLGSIPRRVIPKTQKWYLMLPRLTLSIIRYGSRIKWSNPGKGVAPSPTPWCSSYRKGRLRVTLDYGCQQSIFNTNGLYTTIWFPVTPECVLENETHIFLWDFEMRTDHLTSARRPDLEIVKKKSERKSLPNSGLWCFDRQQSKIKRKRKES